MSKVILEIINLTKTFGGVTAIDNISLQVYENEVSAIIGPNGAGKTTLIGQLTGEIEPDAGSIRFCGQNILSLAPYKRAHLGIARSFQITSVFLDLTVLENASMAVQAHTGHSFQFFKPARDDLKIRNSAMEILGRVGLADRAQLHAGVISHGERRQLEIAMALASKPKLLLLDEPMAGMGPEETQRITDFLQSIKREITIVLIEHDMDTVFALANWLIVLVSGQVIANGKPKIVRKIAEVRKAYLGEREEV